MPRTHDIWYNAKVRTAPQISAEHSIQKSKVRLGTLKETASNVPPMGIKIGGVSRAMPLMPNRRQIRTARRVLLVKSLGLVLRNRPINRWIAGPRNAKITTLVIMPATLSVNVSHQAKPSTVPAMGPPKNLIILEKYTGKYLVIMALEGIRYWVLGIKILTSIA